MMPTVRPQEQMLVEAIDSLAGGRLLCNTAGRAQFAAAYAQKHPAASVACWMLDLYQQEQVRLAHVPFPQNLQLHCTADPPEEPFDVVAWAFGRQGDGELVRETLQIGHERLVAGGQMIVTIDYPRDQWVYEQMQRMFAKVSRRQSEQGVVYRATKETALRKRKNYAAEFAFRDGERLVQLRTRPGVFSHRELDGGARALLKSLRLEPGQRVLDIGCGSGAVGVAAGLRAGAGKVWAMDSNPRAIEATAWAKERNGVLDLSLLLDANGSSVGAGSADVALANPPYYSDFRIARLFVQIAAKALVPGGTLLVVTKSADWYVRGLGAAFGEVTARQVGNYQVVSASKL